MVKNCLMNFIKCLKFIFIPLLAIIIGASIGFLITYSNVKDLSYEIVTDLNKSFSTRIFSEQEFREYVVEDCKELDWTNFSDSISVVNSQDFLQEEIIGYAKSKNLSNYDEEVVVNSVQGEQIRLYKYINIIMICLLLSYYAGYFLTKSLIRKKIAKLKLYKVILVTVADFIVTSLLVTGVTTLLNYIGIVGILSTIIFTLLYEIIALFEAYFAHRNKNTRLKDVINIKSCTGLYISSIIISVINVLLAFIFTLFINPFYSSLLLIPLSIISLTVINLNAESYVIGLNEGKVNHGSIIF